MLVTLPALAGAQVTPTASGTPGDDTQAVRVGATIFYDYTYTASPKATDTAGNLFKPSAFNVARTYINITGNVSHIVSFRITPDISARENNPASAYNGSYIFRLKYGFAQFALDDWTGPWRASWVRIGAQQTPYVDAEEAVYRYRFQGTVFVERDFGIPSSDVGGTFHTNIPNGYGEVHVGYYNGEGYNRAETNNQKGLQVRGTVRPLPNGGIYTRGLRLTGYLVNDQYVTDGTKRRTDGSIWYEHPRVNAGLDYMVGKDLQLPATSPVCTATPPPAPPAGCGVTVDSKGWSVFATPFFQQKGDGFEALLRYDWYEPNEAALIKTVRKREIVGVSYWFPHPGGPAVAALLLDYERVRMQGAATQQRYTLHGLINF
jgi:hypothetical protein